MHAAKSSACSPLHQLGQGGSFSTAGRGQASQPFGVRQILAALLVPPWTAGRSVVVLMDQSFLVALLDGSLWRSSPAGQPQITGV